MIQVTLDVKRPPNSQPSELNYYWLLCVFPRRRRHAFPLRCDWLISFFTSLWFAKVTFGFNWKILQMLLSVFLHILNLIIIHNPTLHWRTTELIWSLIHSNSPKAVPASYSDRGSSSDSVQIKRKEINSSITIRSKYRVSLRTRFYYPELGCLVF